MTVRERLGRYLATIEHSRAALECRNIRTRREIFPIAHRRFIACRVCKVNLTAGEVEMEVQDALDADEKAGHIILAC